MSHPLYTNHIIESGVEAYYSAIGIPFPYPRKVTTDMSDWQIRVNEGYNKAIRVELKKAENIVMAIIDSVFEERQIEITHLRTILKEYNEMWGRQFRYELSLRNSGILPFGKL